MTPRTGHYWQLSSFYLFYFASLGALVPYWGLYLKSLGFSATSEVYRRPRFWTVFSERWLVQKFDERA